ncbi:MAG: glycosyltransferase family 4 protein [Verrucomicrobiota bacterium]
MAKVTIVACVYPPEPLVAGRMCHDLASFLVEEGHAVHVLCPFPSRPLGVDHPGFESRNKVDRRSESGVTVVRLPSYTAPQSSLFPRLRESIGFGRHAARFLQGQLRDSDVVYDLNWPLLGQAMVSRTAVKMNVPLVTSIFDIYPESLLEKLPRSIRFLLAGPLRGIDRRTVRRAKRVVVISENMKQVYCKSRGIPLERLVIVPTWQDERPFWPLPSRSSASIRYGVATDIFTFIYLGNLGAVAGVGSLIQAFHRADLPRAQLLIIGEGSRKAASQSLAGELGCKNVRFISDPEVNNVPLLQSLADVCLLPVKRGAAFSSIPSKLAAYQFSAKPVLAAVDSGSDTARAVNESKGGWVGEPENVNWIANQMKIVSQIPPAQLHQMGLHGRAYGLENYSRAKWVEVLSDVILGVAKKRPTRALTSASSLVSY